MTKKIIFSTGGTGGHILPSINLMKHFFETLILNIIGQKTTEEQLHIIIVRGLKILSHFQN